MVPRAVTRDPGAEGGLFGTVTVARGCDSSSRHNAVSQLRGKESHSGYSRTRRVTNTGPSSQQQQQQRQQQAPSLQPRTVRRSPRRTALTLQKELVGGV